MRAKAHIAYPKQACGELLVSDVMAWNTATDGDDDRYEECEGADPIPMFPEVSYDYGRCLSEHAAQMFERGCENTIGTVKEWLRDDDIVDEFRRQLKTELSSWVMHSVPSPWPWFYEYDPPKDFRLSSQYSFLLLFVDNYAEEQSVLGEGTMPKWFNEIGEMCDCVEHTYRNSDRPWHPFLSCLDAVREDLEKKRLLPGGRIVNEVRVAQEEDGGTDPGKPDPAAPQENTASGDCRYSNNCRTVHWFGEKYQFTINQSLCVKLLIENWKNENVEMQGDSLLESSNIRTSFISQVFKGHPAWNKMIVSPRRGMYKLFPDPTKDC